MSRLFKSYAECHYAESRYAECRYAECRGTIEWKGINRKQSTRWQHISRLKASAFFSLQIF